MRHSTGAGNRHSERSAALFCISRAEGKVGKANQFLRLHENELREYDQLHALFAGVKSGTMTPERASELSDGMTPHEAAKRLAELKPTHDKAVAMVGDLRRASRFSKVRASMQPSEVSRRHRRAGHN